MALYMNSVLCLFAFLLNSETPVASYCSVTDNSSHYSGCRPYCRSYCSTSCCEYSCNKYCCAASQWESQVILSSVCAYVVLSCILVCITCIRNRRYREVHPQTGTTRITKQVKIKTPLQRKKEQRIMEQQDQQTEEIVQKSEQLLNKLHQIMLNLKQQQLQQQQITYCVICMNKTSDCVFADCGHVVTCMECACSTALTKCPICRALVQQKIKVFL